MCLIAWNWRPELSPRLVLLSNRDEFYARPTAPLHWWDSGSAGNDILAGQDLQAGGTWLGVSRSGRLAALTNFRSAQGLQPNATSRGELVTGFLRGTMDGSSYLRDLANHSQIYNPFNLLVFDGKQLMGFESHSTKIISFPTGLGGLSNGSFNAPWPKLRRLRNALGKEIDSGLPEHSRLLELLNDPSQASDVELPKTGVALTLERALSAIFITSLGYGTRACSVVQMGTNQVRFVERRFGQNGLQGTQIFSYEVVS
jgi:uncharacterized protein with NRDE domain